MAVTGALVLNIHSLFNIVTYRAWNQVADWITLFNTKLYEIFFNS